MPSFGQMKAAKDTMSTFLAKKEDAPAKSATPALAVLPCSDASFGQMKAAKDTMSTFLAKKEDAPAKSATPAKSTGGAPMPRCHVWSDEGRQGHHEPLAKKDGCSSKASNAGQEHWQLHA